MDHDDPRFLRVTVRLSLDERAALEIEALRRGVTVASLVRSRLHEPEAVTRGDAGGPGVTRRA